VLLSLDWPLWVGQGRFGQDAVRLFPSAKREKVGSGPTQRDNDNSQSNGARHRQNAGQFEVHF